MKIPQTIPSVSVHLVELILEAAVTDVYRVYRAMHRDDLLSTSVPLMPAPENVQAKRTYFLAHSKNQ